jgi:hypothetical protein
MLKVEYQQDNELKPLKMKLKMVKNQHKKIKFKNTESLEVF